MEKKNLYMVLVILVLGTLFVTACSNGSQPVDDDHSVAGEHMEGDEHDEEGEHAHVDPPHEYEDLSSSFGEDDHEAIEAGEVIYEANCSTCHGPEGDGDGPAAEGLDPQPASLADAHMMEELSDGYLFWRVSEGGVMGPFNSAMPAWKDTLSDDEIWQVITYIREFTENDHD